MLGSWHFECWLSFSGAQLEGRCLLLFGSRNHMRRERKP